MRERAESIIAASNIDKSIQRPLSAFTVIGGGTGGGGGNSSKATLTAKRQKTDQRRCNQDVIPKPDYCKTCGGPIQW